MGEIMNILVDDLDLDMDFVKIVEKMDCEEWFQSDFDHRWSNLATASPFGAQILVDSYAALKTNDWRSFYGNVKVEPMPGTQLEFEWGKND